MPRLTQLTPKVVHLPTELHCSYSVSTKRRSEDRGTTIPIIGWNWIEKPGWSRAKLWLKSQVGQKLNYDWKARLEKHCSTISDSNLSGFPQHHECTPPFAVLFYSEWWTGLFYSKQVRNVCRLSHSVLTASPVLAVERLLFTLPLLLLMCWLELSHKNTLANTHIFSFNTPHPHTHTQRTQKRTGPCSGISKRTEKYPANIDDANHA